MTQKNNQSNSKVINGAMQEDAPALPDNFILKCERSIYEKMQGWTDACSLEAGGMMAVKLVGKGVFEVVDAYIDRQIASSAHLEIEPKALNTRKSKLLRAWGDCKAERDNAAAAGEFEKFIELDKQLTKRKDDLKLLRGEWHSHVDMNCFLSGTDIACALRLCRNDPYIIMLVLNKHKKYYLEAYVRSPFPCRIKGKLEITNKKLAPAPLEIQEPGLTPEQVAVLPEIEAKFGKDAKEAFRDLILKDMQEDYEHAKWEAEQLRWKDIKDQCKKDIEEMVFKEYDYEINEESGEIVKKEFPSTYLGNYDNQRDLYDAFGQGYNRHHTGIWNDKWSDETNTTTEDRESRIFNTEALKKIIG